MRPCSVLTLNHSLPSLRTLSHTQLLTHQTLLSCTHYLRYTGLNYGPLFNKAMDCLSNGTGTALDYIESLLFYILANVRFLLFTSLNSCTPENGYWFCQRWMGVAALELKTKRQKKGREEEEAGRIRELLWRKDKSLRRREEDQGFEVLSIQHFL